LHAASGQQPIASGQSPAANPRTARRAAWRVARGSQPEREAPRRAARRVLTPPRAPPAPTSLVLRARLCRRQMDAFREGLSTVLPLGPLLAFDPLELRALLCGTLDIEWEEAELQRHIHPAGGLTREMPAYRCERGPRRNAHAMQRITARCDATQRSATRPERERSSVAMMRLLTLPPSPRSSRMRPPPPPRLPPSPRLPRLFPLAPGC
jgi:hypothetical protein